LLTNKYSEVYPGRYYGGQQYTDQVETLAIERAKQVFRPSMPTCRRERIADESSGLFSVCWNRVTRFSGWI